jgi:hypothetical protein
MANSIWQATAQTATGAIIPGAEVTVVDEATGLDATIYSTLGGTDLANPFFANSEGFIQFYAAAGTYRVTAEDTGTAQSVTWRYIRFGDSASRDTGILTGQLPSANDMDMVGATQNFTSNNLNPNVFGGDGVDDIISLGVASSSTTVFFLLPVSFISPPSSITVTGTFNITDINSNVIATGVSPNLSGIKSSKVAYVFFFGLSGMTTENSYFLRLNAATSKIQVNQ